MVSEINKHALLYQALTVLISICTVLTSMHCSSINETKYYNTEVQVQCIVLLDNNREKLDELSSHFLLSSLQVPQLPLQLFYGSQ